MDGRGVTEYNLAKRVAQNENTPIFSLDTQLCTMIHIGQQLEALENQRIDLYQNEITARGSAHQHLARTNFINDISSVTEEMTLLTERIRQTALKKSQANETVMHERIISPLRDIDSAKLKSGIEVFASHNNQDSWILLHRTQISNHFEPVILPINGSRLTHIKLLHSEYNYPASHPNPSDVLSQSKLFKEYSDPETKIPTSSLWSEYRNRYGTNVPYIPRKVQLLEVRDIVHRVFNFWKKRHDKNAKGKGNESRTLVDAFFSVIDRLYGVPAVVMKVSFEYLSAIELYRINHYDVLEFANALDGSDTACARCLSLVLTLVKRQWFEMCNNLTDTITSNKVAGLLKLFYPSLKEQELDKVTNDLFTSDTKCMQEGQWSITEVSQCIVDVRSFIIPNLTFSVQINKFFITSFRDATEFWCEATETGILSEFNQERIDVDQFMSFMYRTYPSADSVRLRTRYNEAMQRTFGRDKKTDERLNTINLGYLVAEMRWEDTYKRLCHNDEDDDKDGDEILSSQIMSDMNI